MRALKLLPLARRRGLTAAPQNPSERLPDAASFYEPPRGGAAHDEVIKDREWQSETVTRIGSKE